MGRYSYQQTDKAAKLEAWFKKQVKGLQEHLKDAEIREASLFFCDPFKVSGVQYNKGFMSLIIYVPDRAPEFLGKEDEKIYWHNVK